MNTPSLVRFFLLVTFYCLPLRAGLEPDRDIPKSNFTIGSATETVHDYYISHGGDREMIIIATFYGQVDDIQKHPDEYRTLLGSSVVGDHRSEWAWFVTFTHPHEGNSTVRYRLRENGEISPLVYGG